MSKYNLISYNNYTNCNIYIYILYIYIYILQLLKYIYYVEGVEMANKPTSSLAI